MIRFAWLQFRIQAAGRVRRDSRSLAIVLAITGPHLVHLYDTTVATCAAHGDCSTPITAFLQNDRTLQIWLDVLVVVVPGIIGVFWGAPLVARELEAGTFRLAWTQSVTRTRWLAVKLGRRRAGQHGRRRAPQPDGDVVVQPGRPGQHEPVHASFDQRDLVPIGYAAFAFAFGVTAGVLIRRTVPAMATTLVGFVATRLLFNHFVLPKLIAPSIDALL